MPGNVVFFAVHADDLPRAQRFYERVFGWKFKPWGPPGFYLIETGEKDAPGIPGALQKRHEVVAGQRMNGYECTLSVADIDAAASAVVANGGKILMSKCEIPTVGWIIKFQDPEGNVLCAKQPVVEQAE